MLQRSNPSDIAAVLCRIKQATPNLSEAAKLQARRVAAKQLMMLFGVGAAGGVGVRGLMGLRDTLRPSALPPSHSNNLPYTISVSGFSPEKSTTDDDQQFRKLSTATTPPAPPTLFDRVADKIAPYLPFTATSNPVLSEWHMPIAATALGGGGVAGYKLLDWLLAKDKQRQQQSQLQAAEQDYHDALAEQYRAAMLGKKAGDDLGVKDLADLYASSVAAGMTKQAFIQSSLESAMPGLSRPYELLFGGYDNWQAIKGGINTATLAALLGTGKLTYDWAKGNNKQELLRKALQHRQLLRQRLSPPPIIALTEDQRANYAGS